jgi:hypothetical protein
VERPRLPAGRPSFGAAFGGNLSSACLILRVSAE